MVRECFWELSELCGSDQAAMRNKIDKKESPSARQARMAKELNMRYQDLEQEFTLAWNCSPQIRFATISCLGTIFTSQGQWIAHLIKNVFRTKVRQGGDGMSRLVLLNTNDCITLKQSSGDCGAICVTGDMSQYKSFNNIMTIYSIGKDSGPLRQEELDTFINNKIEKPLIIVLEKELLGNEVITSMLLQQFKKLGNEKKSIECFNKLSTHRDWSTKNDCFMQ